MTVTTSVPYCVHVHYSVNSWAHGIVPVERRRVGAERERGSPKAPFGSVHDLEIDDEDFYSGRHVAARPWK